MATRCPKCRFENPAGMAFCGQCGTGIRGHVPDSPESGTCPLNSELLPKELQDKASVTKTLQTGCKVMGEGKIFAGKYEIIGEIGQGGMGVVYKAEDIRLKRTVALKFLPPEFMRLPDARERFIREAQSAAALSHPNICTIHEVDETDGQPYIAMEFVSGASLRQKVAKGPMAADAVVEIAVQVAEGLEAAHQRGIIHRDIKSANIMVTDKGQAKIMDFGLAKVLGGEQLTREALTIGTVAYMSPEQAQGEDLDGRTDIWSFGVVLYELLTGQLPFRGDRESIILHSIVKLEPKPARQIKPDIPVELQKIIDRALKKNRADRYASACEMAADLRKYLEIRRAEEAGFFNLRSLARRLKKPAYFIPTAALLLALGALAYWRIDHNAHVRWARQVALPQIENDYQANDFTAAYKLTKSAEQYIPKDPQIVEYLGQLTGSLSVKTDPPGAQVFIKDYVSPDAAFELVGLTPFDRAKVPVGYKRWKIIKQGFEVVEGAGQIFVATAPPQANPPIEIKLDSEGSLPQDMIRVRVDSELSPGFGGIARLSVLRLGDFLLDKHEVTNRQYKKFLDDGGYQQLRFWDQKFVRDGKEIPGEEAIKTFVDKSGRPGPATWELGDYPAGQEDYPVCGVSWYEAAAYAEYAGKSLPTIYHWRWAAGDHDYADSRDVSFIVPLSNFGQEGPSPVGRMPGMSPVGAYDIAGNVKEWCWNETSDGKKGNIGGGWDEPNYMFGEFDRYPAWFRSANFGFRCMKYLTQSPVEVEAAKPVPLAPPSVPTVLEPCSDEVFQVYLKLYEYTKSPLNSKIEQTEDFTRHTVFEKVSFNPAYEGDRMGAYLFIPKEGKRPFQIVIHWPGWAANEVNSILEYALKDSFDYLTRTGRAVVLPVIRGTFYRKATPELKAKTTAMERRIMMIKDLLRTVDYLESRPEFDAKKIALEGLSWGAQIAPVIPAIEKRIRADVLIGASLKTMWPPEVNVMNFTPRVTIPVLMQSGRYDFAASLEKELNPLFRLFGTPDKDKSLKLYEAGHAVWLRMEQKRDEIDFLDKYFGPAK